MYDYRIKPEKKLRPYNTAEMKKLVGKIIVDKHYQDHVLVIAAGNAAVLTGSKDLTAPQLLADWYNLDGSPCGVLE